MLGVLIGFSVGSFLSLFGVLDIYAFGVIIHNECSTKDEISFTGKVILRCLNIILVIVLLSWSISLGCITEQLESKMWVDTYIFRKQSVESSIHDPKLTEPERSEFVEQAECANDELSDRKYSCLQWYGFNKDRRLLGLEPINFSGGESINDVSY